jgi:hypothetical protein
MTEPADSGTTFVVASCVAGVLLTLALVHIYWAAGGTAGVGAAVPMRADGAAVFTPRRTATGAVALGLALAAALVLGRAGVAPRVGPPGVYRWGTWALGAGFALRAVGEFRYVGLFKRERQTRFARLDTRVYTPLCAALAAAVFYLAAS